MKGPNEVSFDDILNFPYWFHRIPLDGDRYTPGIGNGPEVWDRYRLPEDLSGKSVLDIGSYNGLFAFEAERRGAERVLATDLWDEDNRTKVPRQEHRREGFELVRNYLDSDVEGRAISVYDIDPNSVGKFDLVLMPGVLYHLKRPVEAIRNICSVAEELVVVQSVLSLKYSDSLMEYAGKEGIGGDPTVWWLPTLESISEMMEIHGCTSTESFYLPLRKTSSSVPPTRLQSIIDDTITIYRDFQLSEPIGEYPAEGSVNVLYQKGDVVRIDMDVETDRDTVEPIQGWVQADAITDIWKRFELPRHAAEMYQEHGLQSTIKMSIGYLRNKNPRNGIVHGWIDSQVLDT